MMRSVLTCVWMGIAVLNCLAQSSVQSGIELQHFDQSVKPADNLYRYVNGNWLKTFVIPPEKASVSTFSLLADQNDEQIKAIIEEVSSTPSEPGSAQRRIGDFYKSFMNTAQIEKLGLTPLKEELAAIERATSHADILRLMAQFGPLGVNTPVRTGVTSDAKNAEQYIVFFGQSGLGMPDRSYYLDETEAMKSLRNDYLIYAETLFKLSGFADAGDRAKTVLDLETRLATHHWTRVESRDRNKIYNKYEQAKLAQEAPGFDWVSFFTASGFKDQTLIVYQPSYARAFAEMFTQVSVADWKSYLALHLVGTFATELSSPFEQADFQFYAVRLSGAQEIEPRWKRGVGMVNGMLGDLVGKLYVEKHFRPEAKKLMEELVANLKSVFAERLASLAWMTPQTRKEALAKLAKFNTKIGYPENWYTYPGLVIAEDDLVGNVKRARLLETQRDIARLGKPVDRSEWFITPQTVNAYYSSTRNEIVFPAAILQPPFFNMNADMAVNYGGIGAVIGHEITHGFDDQGRKSDGHGNLRDWWTETDGKEFEKRAGMMVEQYNEYKPLADVSVNGQLTLGENIADLGGLTVAYYAYKKSLGGKPSPVLDGFTGEQRVFLSWAQIWRRTYRDEALRQMLATDSHSPGEYRTNGIVANMPEFFEAFKVSEGTPLRREPLKLIKIW